MSRIGFRAARTVVPILLLAVPPLLGQARVDDAAIRSAPAGDWLIYGRDYAGTHYSPLDQIRTDNVSRLRLAWSWEIGAPPGRPEATPLVVDGTLYATGAWSVVFALDARTGAVKWKWDPGIVRGGRAAGGPTFCCGPVNRGVALYRGKVFAGLLDGRLVALDAGTGALLWTRQTTPLGEDYSITGAPRVVKGKVIIGNGGAEYAGVRGYLTAYDPDSGEQVWRTYTVPGDPSRPFESPAMQAAAATWKGEWWKLGGGGTVWDSFAFDAELDLLYVGVGNGSPWSRDIRSPGGGDNLFLSSILAIRPDDGQIVWHYQTTPGDDWDYTATQNIVLADMVIGGRERQVLMQAPKNGFFYVIDRTTGELISAAPFTYVSWASAVDPATGRPVETLTARYGSQGAWHSPGPIGAHNWEPMSFNPGTGLVYIPGQNNSQFYRRDLEFEPEPGRQSTGITAGGAAASGARNPAPADLPRGFLLAWDPLTQKERWRIPLPTSRNAGTLTTRGNLVFSGTAQGRFFALNAETGQTLWETELAPGLGSPMTYLLDGRQYVVILAGSGGNNSRPSRVFAFVVDG